MKLSMLLICIKIRRCGIIANETTINQSSNDVHISRQLSSSIHQQRATVVNDITIFCNGGVHHFKKITGESEPFTIFVGLDWPWNWERDDVTCYTTCLVAVRTSTVVATLLVIQAAGFGAAGIVAGPFAAANMGVVNFGGLFAFPFLQYVGVTGVGTTGKMVFSSTVIPLCAAICGSKEKDLKCNTHRVDGMKGLEKNLIIAENVNDIAECEELCNDQKDCRAFRYLPKNSFCFVYNLQQHIEDDISESQFYVLRCVLCYMNTTKNTKGRDDEIESVWEVSSLKECENNCIKSDDCRAVHFDGEKCFKFTNEVKQHEKTGTDFSRKICVQYTD